MSTDFALALADEVNSRLEPKGVLAAIDFHAEKVQESGTTLKAFCPIHKDSRFRSLLIDSERLAFRCTIKTCPGYEGGSLLDLYAYSKSISPLTAAYELATSLNLDLGTDWQNQLSRSYLDEAAAARSTGDLTQAETLLRDFITIMPDSVEARTMLAGVEMELGNPGAAADEYARLIDQLLVSNNYEQAEAVSEEALQLFPANEDFLFHRVKIAEELGNPQLAIERTQFIILRREAAGRDLDNVGLLEQLIQKAPDRPEFALKLAALYEMQHNVRGASRQYENAARTYLASGETAAAIELFEKVVQFNSENTKARLELARELAEFGEMDKAREHTFKAINQHIDQQEFGPAVNAVNSWLVREPDNVAAREHLARIFLEQDRPAEAAAYLTEGAKIATEAFNFDKAADLLLRGKFLTPDDPNLRRLLIAAFNSTEEPKRAAFEMIDLSEILFNSGDSVQAEALLHQGIAMDISLPLKLQMITAMANHGLAATAIENIHAVADHHAQTASVEEQAELYEVMSRLEPENPQIHQKLVEALWQVAPERAADAAAESAELLVSKQLCLDAETILATIAEKIDGYVPAVPRLLELCEQCQRIDLAGAIYQAAIQGFAEEDGEAALKAARRMAALDPSHASAPSDIAYLLATLGRTGEASVQYAEVAARLLANADYENAFQYASEAAALSPDLIPALACQTLASREIMEPEDTASLATTLLSATRTSDDPEAAAIGYLAYTDLYPDDDDLLKEAATRLSQLDSHAGSAQIQARQASRLAIAGDWASACVLLRKAHETAPSIPYIAEQYGEACRLTGDINEAARAYARAATAFVDAGDRESALRCTEQAQNCDSTSSKAWEAIFEATERTGLTAASAQTAQQLAEYFNANGPAPAAARWGRQWVRFAPASPEAHESLGTTLVIVEQTDSAVESLSKAASLYANQGQLPEALDVLNTISDIANLTQNDRETLSIILARESGPEIHGQASLLLGKALIDSGKLNSAREVATDLSKSAMFTLSAKLWSAIAGQETDLSLATEANLHAAENQSQAGDNDSAITYLNAAVALGSPGYNIFRLLAQLLTEEERHSEALPYQLIVIKHLAEQNSADVIPLAQQLRAIQSDDVDALFELGKTLHAAGLTEQALVDLESAATLATNNNNVAALVAICAFDEALTRKSTLLTRARADSLMGMENEQQALEWVRSSARDLIAADKPAEALEMAQRWLSLAPQDIEANQMIAETLTVTGRSVEAQDARLALARILADANQFDEALSETEKLLEISSASQPALILKANILQKSQQLDAASEVLLQLGQIQLESGDTDAALQTFQDVLALRPDDTTALWNQADVLRNTDGIAAALPQYRQWLNVRKAHQSPAVYINDVQAVLALAPASIPLLRELTETILSSPHPQDADPHLEELSRLLEAEGNYTAAAEALELALQHTTSAAPERHTAVAGLYEKANSPGRAQDHLRTASTTWLARGNSDEAIHLLNRVVKLSGDAPLPEDHAALAKLYASSGQLSEATKSIGTALSLLGKVSGNIHRREIMLQQALEIEPLNADYVLQHMDLLPPGRAMTEGLRASRNMHTAGHHEDAVRIITKLIALAPHDMSLRQELFAPLRQSGNKSRLRQELMALAVDAIAAGDSDAAAEALDEAATLATSASQLRTIAELNERARRTDHAAAMFAASAEAYAKEGKSEPAIAAINRAISAKPSAVSAQQMAALVKLLGEPVHDIAREQLRSELTARRQKQSQILALALLEASSADRTAEILKTVSILGGSTFVVGIAHQRVRLLLEDKDVLGALELVNTLLETAPDSPDAWHLAAQINNQAGQNSDARRCALEAARLFHTAGAVIEEEDAYRVALQAEPDNATVKSALAEYLIREKRNEEAIEMLQQGIAKAELSGNTDLLLECLNRAVQIAPGNTDLREKLAGTLESLAPDSAIEHWLEAARMYNENDQATHASRVYEHILKMHPSNETALQELLKAAADSGNLAAAARLTRSLADVKVSRRNVGEAVRLLQRYLELDADNLDILEKLASLSGSSNNPEVFTATTRALAQRLQKMGNHEQALNQYELLLERSPRDTRLLMTLIDCSAAAGLQEKGSAYARQLLAVAKETEDPDRVRVAASTILNYEPEDAGAHNDLGEAFLSLNRVPEAVAEWLRAGEAYESTGNTASAYTCYRRITQVNPATIQAWKRLADIAITIGDLETARMAVLHVLDKSGDAIDQRTAPLLNRLLQALPDDPQVHKTALDFYRRIGDKDLAATEYTWLANQALSDGHPDQADSYISEALAWAPGHPGLRQAHHNIIRQMGRIEELQLRLRKEAEGHEAAGQHGQAIAVMEELVELAPGQIALHRDLARLLQAADRHEDSFFQNLEVIRLLLDRSELEEARDLADALAKVHAKDFTCRERIADLLAKSAFPDVAARHYMAAAKVAQTQKKPDQAIDLLAKAVTARPSWPESRKALAEACEKADRIDQAFEAWIGMTAILLDAGEYSEATATLDRLATQRPDSPEVREQLASLYERTGNRTQHAVILRELLDLYEANENSSAALDTFRKLVSIQPDDPTLLTRYVEMLSQNGSDPANLSDEYTRLADMLAKKGDYEAAFQTYEQVLGVSPENTTARSRYATFLLSRGSRNRALSEMRTLAAQYTEREEHAAAVEVLNAALAISPRDADLCLTLAKAQEAAGMHEDARVSYSRATAILASTAAVKGIDTYRRILSQDENNTAVRLRLVELLINSGDKMEAAREARILAEIHISRGELHEAENAYRLVDECEPESLDEVRAAISRDSYDPSLQYVHYVRLGNRLMEAGDIDAALDTFRTARSLHDDQPELIQKCIECVSLIAPEAEAIPDYLLMAEKLLLTGDFPKARQAYEQVRLIDPFNNDAKCGLESVNVAERSKYAKKPVEDELVLKAGRAVSKRVALLDLLVACQEAALDTTEDKRLGG